MTIVPPSHTQREVIWVADVVGWSADTEKLPPLLFWLHCGLQDKPENCSHLCSLFVCTARCKLRDLFCEKRLTIRSSLYSYVIQILRRKRTLRTAISRRNGQSVKSVLRNVCTYAVCLFVQQHDAKSENR